jgi:hypothetical protein
MKQIKIIMLLIILSAMAAGTGMVSAMPFDGFSDVDITDHTEEYGFGSVANAGDLNGDGYFDLVIGADAAKKAFVYFGGPDFDNVSDLTIDEHTAEVGFGISVANSGDLNNDGYTDLVIGAYGAKKAFVYFGGPGFDNVSDVTIEDHNTTGLYCFGWSVANAGDLNNDGYTDLVIGAPGSLSFSSDKAFVYFGGPGFNNVSDVTIDDHTTEVGFGISVANAGDLNADGYADLVIGAFEARKAFVYFGGPGFNNVSDVTIDDHITANFGGAVANAGDLNNDGYTDLAIGAGHSNEAFIYFGGPGFDGFSDVDITEEGGFGQSVANAGDLNNDGYADLVIGAYWAEKAFVYYGGPGFDNISDVDITDHIGETYFGVRVIANAGDLNNDGYTDLVICAAEANKAFVYYGVDYPLKYLPQPTIVTLQGKLTDTAGNPIQTGSLKVTINDTLGTQVWQSTFNDSLFDGVFNIPLGAVQELRLIPGNMYQMVIEIDVGSATFALTDVTFGDNDPAGDVIKFTA